MSTTTTTTTTTTMRDIGDRYGPMEWAQQGSRQEGDVCFLQIDDGWTPAHLANRTDRQTGRQIAALLYAPTIGRKT